jgi:hypothetical protein
MESLLEDISGDPNAKKLTMEGFFENLLPAAASCGINAAGGLIAGRLDKEFMEWKPNWPHFPAFGIAIVAIALKAACRKMNAVDNVVRDIASGMAGWVGDDIFYGIRNFFFRKDWVAGKSYKKGDEVKYGGKIWQAKADIDYPPQAEPGKDARWEEVRAQGFRLEDLRHYAQAFVSDERRVDRIASDVAVLMAEKGQVPQDQREAFMREMKKTLQDVVAQF